MMGYSSTRLAKINELEENSENGGDFAVLMLIVKESKRNGDFVKLEDTVNKIAEILTNDQFGQDLVKRLLVLQIFHPQSYDQLKQHITNPEFDRFASYVSVSGFEKLKGTFESFESDDEIVTVLKRTLTWIGTLAENRHPISSDFDKNARGFVDHIYNSLAFSDVLNEFENLLNEEVIPNVSEANTMTLSAQIRDFRDMLKLIDDTETQENLIKKRSNILISDDLKLFLFRKADRRILRIRHQGDGNCGVVFVPVKSIMLKTLQGRQLYLEFDQDELGNRANYNVCVLGSKPLNDCYMA